MPVVLPCIYYVSWHVGMILTAVILTDDNNDEAMLFLVARPLQTEKTPLAGCQTDEYRFHPFRSGGTGQSTRVVALIDI